MSVRR